METSTIPPSKHAKTLIKTTLPALPLPPNALRTPLTTSRLLIRPLSTSDLPALHRLRTQPEIMANNPQGRPDRDLAETKPRLEAYLPPKDEKTFTFAICLLDTEEMIGIGGCYSLKSMFGWPVVGYMLDREYWGRGLATEFLRGWLGMWAALPRMDDQVEIEVDARTVAGGDENEGVVMEEEQVVTWTVAGENMASERVMQKSGFECFLRWREPDLRAPEVEVELVAYRYFPMRKKTTIREE